MLKILNPDSLRDTSLLAKLHQLRYKVFVKELGWKNGIIAVNQLEIDCYDHSDAFYLVDIDNDDNIYAGARLTQTIYPNVLLDSFGDNVDSVCRHRSPDIIEISRFCADKNNAPKMVMGNIIAGLLEIGLHYNTQEYVSFSNTNIQRRSERFGWHTEKIGPVTKIDNTSIVALRHRVNINEYLNVCKTIGLDQPLLNSMELERCPLKNTLMAM